MSHARLVVALIVLLKLDALGGIMRSLDFLANVTVKTHPTPACTKKSPPALLAAIFLLASYVVRKTQAVAGTNLLELRVANAPKLLPRLLTPWSSLDFAVATLVRARRHVPAAQLSMDRFAVGTPPNILMSTAPSATIPKQACCLPPFTKRSPLVCALFAGEHRAFPAEASLIADGLLSIWALAMVSVSVSIVRLLRGQARQSFPRALPIAIFTLAAPV